jgi:hypothetical protein
MSRTWTLSIALLFKASICSRDPNHIMNQMRNFRTPATNMNLLLISKKTSSLKNLLNNWFLATTPSSSLAAKLSQSSWQRSLHLCAHCSKQASIQVQLVRWNLCKRQFHIKKIHTTKEHIKTESLQVHGPRKPTHLTRSKFLYHVNNFINLYLVFIQIYYTPHIDMYINPKH